MIKHVIVATLVGLLVALGVVLPLEYGVDPLGTGRLLGVAGRDADPTGQGAQGPVASMQPVVMVRTPAGLEPSSLPARDSEDDPIPLPDPAVFSDRDTAPRRQTITVTLGSSQQTELKVVAETGAVVLFDWQASGAVYADFHGHLPDAETIWVRYREDDEAKAGAGSLLAPFSGEHGWYWLNYSDDPVTITLNVSGYFDDIVDYGVTSML